MFITEHKISNNNQSWSKEVKIMDKNNENMIIKTKGIFIMYASCAVGALIILTIGIMYGISVFVIVLSIMYFFLLGLWDALAFGKKLTFSKTGITVNFLFFQKELAWDELKTKRIESFPNALEYRTPNTRGAIFSRKFIKRPSLIKPATLAQRHPFSLVFVYFKPEEFVGKFGKINREQVRFYECDEIEFVSKLKEWGVELETNG